MKRHVRQKYDPLVDEVELLEANPQYAHVRLPDGRETTVSIRHLAPRGTACPPDPGAEVLIDKQDCDKTDDDDCQKTGTLTVEADPISHMSNTHVDTPMPQPHVDTPMPQPQSRSEPSPLRRSTRATRMPSRYDL